jgi:outer membrane protein assembly factor BamB
LRVKAALPPGHASPVIAGDRIYLAGVKEGVLLTIALDRQTGAIVWQREAAHDKLEKVHRIGSHAQSTPATDGEVVVRFFGSSGLWCYRANGDLAWSKRMGPFNNDFGAGSSPIIVGKQVILGQDHDTGSFLTAFDLRDGRESWRVDRGEFPRGYATPCVWEQSGKQQLVVCGAIRVLGYDVDTGTHAWTLRGISRMSCATPIIGDDGMLYVSGWSAGGDPGERLSLPPFDKVMATADKNGNGTLEKDETPEGALDSRFSQCDRDKSGSITRVEYEDFRGLFDQSQNQILCVRPGGSGDISETHVVWKQTKQVPFCPSLLVHQGRLFTVKDGGIFASLEAASGRVLKGSRLAATDDYYASPVLGDGKLYLFNEEGKGTVISAAGQWETLSTCDLGETAYASPAIADGRLYVRTAGHLYCFGVGK